ncbi:DUF3093 domain-containing protein [Nocardioides agariphilus]|uniref:DUF3093 domain-containing protein n=1 Tax=Nocardioides agariphilus TaxID=433664 RepID=UPI00351FBB26
MAEPTYAERLGIPLRWWAQGVMLLATFWLAFVVAIPGAWPWLLTGVLATLLVLTLTSYGSVRLVVGGGEFRAARAHIALEHLGPAEILDEAATRLALGPDADARAFLVARPYLKQSVRVPLTDPADPTPYWLVGTRHPEALAAALNSSGPR